MSPTNLPDPAAVGRRAAEVVAMIEASDEYTRFRKSSKAYDDCWATFTGFPLISQWNLQRDVDALFTEGLRVLALKTAVFELSGGDEHAAELEVSAPVDEMVHAILAQYTLCQDMTAKLGIRFVHMTDQERFAYEHGGYTDQCYAAAGWGEQNRRYWLDRTEMMRRMGVLGELYEGLGIERMGRGHGIDFESLPDGEPALVAVS
ncbi:hypothetical protein [Actinoplanes sp. N902-109]|uniref:hypothetical protein n=1 Tax=Actinoplanes sp. (strain N902-109) TaxID=649831 RepID=UPI0003295A1B|nr:hypothetical protein [Actinoplanes sp. N902-109]AGL19477.1 hypothetical protein L083_5967 [Actinoplanes sp. N902-109]